MKSSRALGSATHTSVKRFRSGAGRSRLPASGCRQTEPTCLVGTRRPARSRPHEAKQQTWTDYCPQAPTPLPRQRLLAGRPQALAARRAGGLTQRRLRTSGGVHGSEQAKAGVARHRLGVAALSQRDAGSVTAASLQQPAAASPSRAWSVYLQEANSQQPLVRHTAVRHPNRIRRGRAQRQAEGQQWS
jgi:hypothetical protein